MANFGPPPVAFPFGAPNLQQTQLQPSALPRNFNGPSFDPPYPRGGPPGLPSGMPSPIGPPSKPKTPMAGPSGSPTTPGGGPGAGPPSSLAPGSGRRSIHTLSDVPGSSAPPAPPLLQNLGPISRPIAPIARPTGSTSAAANGGGAENPSPGSTSPVRRSPSPKGLLGSSALAADDDEVVPAAIRRPTGIAPFGGVSLGVKPALSGLGGVSMMSGGGSGAGVGGVGVGMIGQPPWGPSSPRGAVGDNHIGLRSTPWGPPPGFSAAPGARPSGAPPPPIGPPGNNHNQGLNNHNHNHNGTGNGLHPIGHPHPHHPGPHPHPPPPGPPGAPGAGASLWGNPAPGGVPDWQAPPFFGGPFMSHNTPGSPSRHSG